MNKKGDLSRHHDNSSQITDAKHNLRSAAEALIIKEEKRGFENFEELSLKEMILIVHELRVHQIELEMQNNELKRIQLELNHAKNRYFDIYDLAPLGYLIVSEKELIIESNLTAAMMLGVTRNNLIKQKLSQYIHREDQDNYYIHRKKLFETMEPEECELRIVRNDGTAFWGHMKATVVTEEGLPVCRLILSDISARKEAEIALRESEQKYTNYIENAPDGIFITDETGQYLEVNKAAMKMTGYKKNELLHMKINDILTPETLNDGKKHFKRLLEKGKSSGSMQYKHKDGTNRWWTVDAVKLTNHRFLGFVKDITERKLAEEELQASEEKSRTLIEQSTDGIIVTDEHGNIALWNKGTESITGLNACDTIGAPLWKVQAQLIPDEIKTPELLEQLRTGMESIFKLYIDWQGESREQTIISADGKRKTVHDSTFTIKTNNSLRIGTILHDITGHKLTEEALRESEKQYRMLAEGMADVVWILNIETMRFRYVSPSVKKMRGYTSEEVLTQPIGDSLTPESHKRVNNLMKIRIPHFLAQAEENASYIDEIDQPHKNGSIVHTEVTTSFLLNEEGKVEVIGVSRDITERKLVEQKLVELFRQHQQVLNGAAEGILGLDSNGIPTFVNPAAATMLGYKIEELLDRPSHSLWHHTRADGSAFPEEQCKLHISLQQGVELRKQDDLFWRKDGTSFPVELACIPNVQVGEQLAAVMTFSDITERKHTENKIKIETERYNALIESTNDWIWAVDSENYKLTLFNTAVSDYFKKNHNIILKSGMTHEEMFSENRRDLWKDLYNKAVSEGRFSIEYQTISEDLNFIVSLAPVVIEDKTVAVSVFAKNITKETGYKTELEISNQALSKRLKQTINTVSKIGELRDAYTAGHQKKVMELSCAIAQEMGLSDEVISNISDGALIHDIGKIYISSDILNKPGKISNLEYQMLKTHVDHSYDIVKDIDFPTSVKEMIHQHHERMDGSGYPNKLAGDQIIIEGRILAVADVVEAMSSHRPYRPALGIDKALEEILLFRDIKYDGDVVDACVRLFREKGFRFMSIND